MDELIKWETAPVDDEVLNPTVLTIIDIKCYNIDNIDYLRAVKFTIKGLKEYIERLRSQSLVTHEPLELEILGVISRYGHRNWITSLYKEDKTLYKDDTVTFFLISEKIKLEGIVGEEVYEAIELTIRDSSLFLSNETPHNMTITNALLEDVNAMKERAGERAAEEAKPDFFDTDFEVDADGVLEVKPPIKG